LADHNNLQFEVTLTYKPAPYYYFINGVKTPRPGLNNYPSFTVIYQKGIPADRFSTDFDLVKLGLSHQVKTGVRSKLTYNAEVGYFIRNKVIYFNEYKHFAANPYLLGLKNTYPVFQLLDYYSNSIQKGYIEGHLVYQTPKLILKRLPVLRNRLWTESLTANYLYVPNMGNQLELGYGMGNGLYTISLFGGLNNQGFKSIGLRISLSVFSSRQIEIAL